MELKINESDKIDALELIQSFKIPNEDKDKFGLYLREIYKVHFIKS